MGFFSYNCKECNHSILSRHSTNEGINEWMSHVVVLGSDGSRIDGEYDGYGRVEDEEIDEDEDRSFDAAYLHYACWEIAGKPEFAFYGTPSDSAKDQGYFFSDGDHDLIDPRVKEGREELLAKGIKAREGTMLVEENEDGSGKV
mgnify:CR=1 FL=1